MLQSFGAAIEELAEINQGTVLNLQQDTGLITFEDGPRTLHFAKELQARFRETLSIPVRMGIHYGKVPVRDGVPMGYDLYITKQIERKAEANMILLSGEVRSQLKSVASFPMLEVETVYFPQANQPVDLFALALPGLDFPEKKTPVAITDQSSLKTRRLRILQLFVAYLLGAWTILQFVEWTLDRYQLSPYWVDILFWIFLGVIPSILFYLLLRWQYRQVSLLKRDRPVYLLNVSLLLLALYFGFGSKELGSVKREVSYLDEDGNTVTVQTVREAFRTQLMLFRFEPLESDSMPDWGKVGIPASLKFSLQQDKYLTIYSAYDEEKLAEKIATAQIYNMDYFLDGNFRFENEMWKVTPILRNAENGMAIKEQTFEGVEIMILLDSVATFVRQSILSPAQMTESVILPIKGAWTDNEEAFQWGSEGFVVDRFGSANVKFAARLDSTFAFANLEIAKRKFKTGDSRLEAVYRIKLAMEYRERLPFAQRLETEMYHYLINGENKKAEDLLRLQLKLNPKNEQLREALIQVFWSKNAYDKVFEESKILYEELPTRTNKLQYLNAALVNEKHRLVIREARAELEKSPQDLTFRRVLWDAYIHSGQYNKAREIFQEMILLKPETETALGKVLESIDFQESNLVKEEILNILQGSWSFNEAVVFQYYHRIGDQIYVKDPNSRVFFIYPNKEGTLNVISNQIGYQSGKFLSDDHGNIYGMILYNGDGPHYQGLWKQDSLIRKAEELLEQEKYAEARVAYQEAIKKHPEHYYLQTALQHIEYHLSLSPEEWKQQALKVSGAYDAGQYDLQWWCQDGCLLQDRLARTNRWRVLFLSETEFTFFEKPNLKGEVVFEKDGPVMLKWSWYNFEQKEWGPTEKGTSAFLGREKIF